jgi:hypothetical protein
MAKKPKPTRRQGRYPVRPQEITRALVPRASGETQIPPEGDDGLQDRPDEILIRAEDIVPYRPGPKGPKWTDQDEQDRRKAMQAEADEIAQLSDAERLSQARAYATEAKRARAAAKAEAAKKRKAAQRFRERMKADAPDLLTQAERRLELPDAEVNELQAPGSHTFVSKERVDGEGHVYGGGRPLDLPPLRRTTGRPVGRPPSAATQHARYIEDRSHRKLLAEWPSLRSLLTAQQVAVWEMVKLKDMSQREAAAALSVGTLHFSQQRISQLVAEVEAIRKPLRVTKSGGRK